MKILLSCALVALIFVFTALFVRLALGRPGWRPTLRVWREWRPAFRQALLIWLAVFLFDLMQTALDGGLSRSLRADFTPVLFAFEGDFVARLQSALSFAPLSWLLAFAYVILFPALLFGSAHAYDRLGDVPRLKMTAYAYGLNYLFCLPFYIFFPVTEPWYSQAGVAPLTDLHVWPWLIDILRPMSGLDNCFPSYHTSLTVSLVLIAAAGSQRAFARAAAVSGALIVVSTVYLGFHWMLDVLTGVIAGLFVYGVARWMVFEDSDLPLPVSPALEEPSRSRPAGR